MHRTSTIVVLLACLTLSPILAAPPSDDPKNSAQALSPEDTEAWSNANKAKEALGSGLLERARILARKAEAIKRTRETAYLMGAVELRSAIGDVVRAAEVLEAYENLVKLGKPDDKAIGIAEQSLNLASVQLDDAKLWEKEVRRLDASYKNLEFLSTEIKKCESNIDRLDKQLVDFKALEIKPPKELADAGKKDSGKSNAKGKAVAKGASLAELLSAGEWDTEFIGTGGRSARGKWHYEFAADGSFTATRADLAADKFDRAKLIPSEYKGKWTVETRKLTRDEMRSIGKVKITGTVPVLTVTLEGNEVQYPFEDLGENANGTFKGIVNTSMSKTSRVVFASLYSDNLVLPDPSGRPLILIHP